MDLFETLGKSLNPKNNTQDLNQLIQGSSFNLLANYASYSSNCVNNGVMPEPFDKWLSYIDATA